MEFRRTGIVRGKGGVSVASDIIRLTVVNRSIILAYETVYALSAQLDAYRSKGLQQIDDMMLCDSSAPWILVSTLRILKEMMIA